MCSSDLSGKFLLFAYGVSARTRRFAAYVYDAGARRRHPACLRQCRPGIQMPAAIVERVRGDVEDAHHLPWLPAESGRQAVAGGCLLIIA